MDPVTQAEIIELLRQLTRRNGTALLYIFHDLLSVLQLCNRLVVLYSNAIECIWVLRWEAQHPATLFLPGALPVPVRCCYPITVEVLIAMSTCGSGAFVIAVDQPAEALR
jgi:energy-coupling factor transporter ATP-binding protein EcfA2